MASDPNIPDPNDPTQSGAGPDPGADPAGGALTPDALAQAQAAAEQSLKASGSDAGSGVEETPAGSAAGEPAAAETGAGPVAEAGESADPPPTAISPEELEAALRTMQSADANAAEAASADALVAAAGESAPPMSDVEAAMMAMMGDGSGAGAARSAASAGGAGAPPTQAFDLPSLSAGSGEVFSDLSLLDDVELDVKIELGRTDMYIEDVLKLGVGSVIELDRLAGDPVDIYVNERLVARGEVLVLNDNFCVRINDIVSAVPEHEVHP